jgi:transcriptional regulator with XRE-family HTH domain
MKARQSLIDRLRAAVAKSRLSRYELAKQSGIDQAALLRFVRGGSLRIESVEKLCPILGLQLTLTTAKRIDRVGRKQRTRRTRGRTS